MRHYGFLILPQLWLDTFVSGQARPPRFRYRSQNEPRMAGSHQSGWHARDILWKNGEGSGGWGRISSVSFPAHQSQRMQMTEQHGKDLTLHCLLHPPALRQWLL